MALTPTGPPGPGPRHGATAQSLLDVADLDEAAKRRRWRRRKTLIGLFSTGLAIPALLVGLALQFSQLGLAIRAAHGEGTRGEFTLQQYGCGRTSCAWSGVFAADKGRLTLRDVAFGGPLPGDARRGLVVPALYSGDAGTVYPVTGSTAWIGDAGWLAFEVLGVLFFGAVLAYSVKIRAELRRPSRPMTTEEREALRRRQARFRERVDRRLRRQRNRPTALNGRGFHTPH
jgi:hypothetical protein